MKTISLLIIFAVFGLFTETYSQKDSVIEKIIEIGKNDNRSMKHLDVLCNRIGGRPIGSDAYDNATKWAVGKFKEWGMQVELDEVGELPVGFNRGPWFGRMLGGNGMNLHFATPSYSAGTKGIQKGHVLLEPKTQAEFNKMKGRLKGAWVLITGKNTGWTINFSDEADNMRDSIIAKNIEIIKENKLIKEENKDLKPSKQKELIEIIDKPALFYKQMKEAGILGIIQSSSVPIRAMYSGMKNINKMTFENLPSVPDIKLDEHQYKIIKQMVKERRTFELEFDIRNHFRIGPIKYHNVIGIIPGTEFPNEYVIMGGHLDAYDVATGGIDDGSGVTPIMEAARLIMKAGGKPKRTILVCLWAGEEFGILGSRSWLERNEDKLDNISNMFNRDGGPTAPAGISVSDSMWDDMVKICEPLNDINPEFPFKVNNRKPSKQPLKAWGTDSGPFAVKGIPVMAFHSTDPKGHDFDYYEIWHTERDLYNISIPENQEHTAIINAIVILGIANLDHLLSREGFYISN